MMQDSARRIARVSVEAKLPLEEDSYVEKFRPNLMDVVYAWAKVCIIIIAYFADYKCIIMTSRKYWHVYLHYTHCINFFLVEVV